MPTANPDPYALQELQNQARTYVAHRKRTLAHADAVQTMQGRQTQLEHQQLALGQALAELEPFDLEVSGVRVQGGGGDFPTVIE